MPLILTKRMLEHPEDSWEIETFERTGGYKALEKAVTQMTPEEVHEEVKTSGLRGRGGAGFPTGTKWNFLPEGVYPRYLVANCDEAEPGTFKDRMLTERDPHQLLEGMLIAAYAIGCEHAFIYCRGELRTAYDTLSRAIGQARERGLIGQPVFGTDFKCEITLHRAAGAYICGEETALLSSLEGYRGWPRLRPPFPAVEGVYAKPTIVNNVETLSNLAWIVENGGAAYAELGVNKSTGTRLFCLSGHVSRPGNYEIEHGLPFGEFFEKYGGGVRDGKQLKAFVPGGASSPWFDASKLDVPMDMDVVTDEGSMLGSGAIMVMDADTDIVKAAARVVKFFEVESCGQCTPCREGCKWLYDIYDRLLTGRGRPEDIDLLLDVGDNISPGLAWPPAQTTICVLGPSAVAPVMSSIRLFRNEYEAKIAANPAASRPRIPVTPVSKEAASA